MKIKCIFYGFVVYQFSDIAFQSRSRKHLERLRPPSVTELLLSNDGERILEGCLTNFFVVSLKVSVLFCSDSC